MIYLLVEQATDPESIRKLKSLMIIIAVIVFIIMITIGTKR